MERRGYMIGRNETITEVKRYWLINLLISYPRMRTSRSLWIVLTYLYLIPHQNEAVIS